MRLDVARAWVRRATFRTGLAALVCFVAVAWCVSGAEAVSYIEDFDSWVNTCTWNSTPNDSTCSDSGTLYTTRTSDGLESGSVCLRGSGKCPRYNMNDNGQYASTVYPNATSGVAGGQAISGTTMTTQMWFKLMSGFGWPRNAIKMIRYYDSDSTFFRITLHGEDPAYGIAWASDDPLDTLDTRNITTVDFSSYDGEWLLWQSEINTSTGAVTVKVYQADGTQLLSESDTFTDIVGHTIDTFSLPDYWTPDGALVGGTTFPDPNYYWADEVQICDAVGVGVGTGGACEVSFPGAPATTCGDGVREGSEACDDGDTSSGDGCSATCTVESGWSCSGVSPDTCSTTCGDSIVAGAEACDDGGTTAGDGCSATCTVETSGTCGDSVVYLNPPGSGTAETCDDGNTTAGDGCSATCQTETSGTCGDGVTYANPPGSGTAEACDDGDTVLDACAYGDAPPLATDCNADCSAVASCSSPQYCGDGAIQSGEGEACDDSGTDAGDGCSATCTVESGWSCAGEPSSCSPVAVSASPVIVGGSISGGRTGQ